VAITNLLPDNLFPESIHGLLRTISRAGFFDFKGFDMLLYDHIQAYIDAIRMHVPKAKYDYTGRFATTGREQFRKNKIMSQQDAAFIQSFFQDERIECPLKTLILKDGRRHAPKN
jgi:hypothetical protein